MTTEPQSRLEAATYCQRPWNAAKTIIPPRRSATSARAFVAERGRPSGSNFKVELTEPAAVLDLQPWWTPLQETRHRSGELLRSAGLLAFSSPTDGTRFPMCAAASPPVLEGTWIIRSAVAPWLRAVHAVTGAVAAPRVTRRPAVYRQAPGPVRDRMGPTRPCRTLVLAGRSPRASDPGFHRWATRRRSSRRAGTPAPISHRTGRGRTEPWNCFRSSWVIRRGSAARQPCRPEPRHRLAGRKVPAPYISNTGGARQGAQGGNRRIEKPSLRSGTSGCRSCRVLGVALIVTVVGATAVVFGVPAPFGDVGQIVEALRRMTTNTVVAYFPVANALSTATVEIDGCQGRRDRQGRAGVTSTKVDLRLLNKYKRPPTRRR